MKLFFSFFLVFIAHQAQAQKRTSQKIDASTIENIILLADEVYRIEVETTAKDVVEITTVSDGEYFNNISLDVRRKDGQLILDSRYRGSLAGGYDKLSAHKVFAMEVQLKVPENIKLELHSNIANTRIAGRYKEILVELNNGSAFLENFSGHAVVHTIGGNIKVETSQDSEVKAESRNGKLDISDGKGPFKLQLKSVDGNIEVIQKLRK